MERRIIRTLIEVFLSPVASKKYLKKHCMHVFSRYRITFLIQRRWLIKRNSAVFTPLLIFRKLSVIIIKGIVLLESIKAFDTVWHDALLLKLFQCGITGHLWLLLTEMHSAMQSCVLFNCNYSQ